MNWIDILLLAVLVFFVIKGWILEKNEEKIKNMIDTSSKGCAIYESKIPASNPDNPPTYLESPRWADGFKGLVNMFSTPRYNEINPTIIMGIFFIFQFLKNTFIIKR